MAQQKALAKLQSEVAVAVKQMKGRQTALNEVSSPDGKAVLSLPVPTGPEFLDGAPASAVQGAFAVKVAAKAQPSDARASGYYRACPYSSASASGRWVCLYQFEKFNGLAKTATGVGDSGRMLKFQDGGSQALWPYEFENKPSSIINSSTHDWFLYDWKTGNTNCGSSDTWYAASSITVKKVDAGLVAETPTLRGADNKTDCVRRLTT